jgi:hypothetical protein
MKCFLTFQTLLIIVALQVIAAPAAMIQTITPPAGSASLTGRWQVKFTLSGVGQKNLILESRGGGAASILLLDTGPDDRPVDHPLPASLSITTNGRVNFSSEVELPIGTCCREIGTLVFKGKITSDISISGTAIFIGSTQDEENPLGFRSMLGTFTATRMRTEK